MAGKQPEGRVATIIKDQILRRRRLQVFTGQHPLPDVIGVEFGVHHHAIEHIHELGQPPQGDRRP
jgi:hypothetical protein